MHKLMKRVILRNAEPRVDSAHTEAGTTFVQRREQLDNSRRLNDAGAAAMFGSPFPIQHNAPSEVLP